MSKLKFSIGYPCAAPLSFFNTVAPYLDRVGELYFAADGFATGRAVFENDPRYDGEKLHRELAKFAECGVRLNLLLNGNCYGGEAISQALAERVKATVGAYYEKFGLHTVTTASPFIAETIKRSFPEIDVRASVNMWVDGIDGMEQCAELFDSFYVKRDHNYSVNKIAEQHEWCKENGKKLYLLANSGCIPNCAYHSFHDNMIAHSAALAKEPKVADFEPYGCRRLFKNPQNRYRLLAGNLVRPEDVHHYEELVDGVKLATRIHPFPALVIAAYKRGRWDGDVTALTEPGFGDLLAPSILENAAIPEDYWEKRTTCARAQNGGDAAACRTCGYCKSIYNQILTNIPE